MSNIKKNERYIPIKNYVVAAIIVVVTLLLTWYGFSWYNVIQENKVSTSYLVKEKEYFYHSTPQRKQSDSMAYMKTAYRSYDDYPNA